jgi:hypothetical protein
MVAICHVSRIDAALMTLHGRTCSLLARMLAPQTELWIGHAA